MYTLSPSLSVEDVHKKINSVKNLKNKFKLAIFFEKKNFSGILSLGDIRRLLLEEKKYKKVKPFLNTNPISVTEKDLNQNLTNLINKKISLSKITKIEYVLVFNQKKTKVIKILSLNELDNIKYKSISVIGAGHIGIPLSIHLNKKNFIVNLHDVSSKKLFLIKKNKVPILEKNLNQFLKNSLLNKKLMIKNMSNLNSQIYVICIGSSLTSNGLIDNKNLISLTKKISENLKINDLIIFRGTTNYGFISKKLIPVITKNTKHIIGKEIYVSYCPERIVEGDALFELENIPQLISGYTSNCLLKAFSFWSNFNNNLIKCTSIEQAELIKLISNSYRDLQFSFANSISKLSSKYNISAIDTIEKANFGYSRNLIAKPSVGVGGSCLVKDPILLFNSNKTAYPFGKISRKINNQSLKDMSLFIRKFTRKFKLNKKVLIVGLAFKGYPETIDLRHSPSIEMQLELNKYDFKSKFLDINQKLMLSHKLIKKEYIFQNKKSFNFDTIIIMNNNLKYIDLINNIFLNSSKKYYQKLFIDPWCLYDTDLITSKGFFYKTL